MRHVVFFRQLISLLPLNSSAIILQAVRLNAFENGQTRLALPLFRYFIKANYFAWKWKCGRRFRRSASAGKIVGGRSSLAVRHLRFGK